MAILALTALPLLPFKILPASGMPGITAIADIANLSGNAMLTVIGFTIFIAGVAIAYIQSIIRLVRGKACALGFIIPIIAIIGIGITLFGLGKAAIAMMPIVFGALAILLLLFNIIGSLKSKKAK